jgi:hypothetical protein
MKHKIAFILLFLALGKPSFAQTEKEKLTPEDKQEKNQARTIRINEKNDYALFRKQLLGLKEYADEKKKAPKLQAENKAPVKVVVAIDSIEEGDTITKTLTGYIVQNIGDNATLMYDVTFDRAQKKIISVKRTAEATEADKEDSENATDKNSGEKPAVHKKNKDDDDDEPEEKPSKER